MFRLLKALFGGRGPAGSCVTVEGYWCDCSVRLPRPVRTPLGGRVTAVKLCLDVTCSVQDMAVEIQSVRLARNVDRNIAATRRGEIWYANSIDDPELALEAAKKELQAANSPLRRFAIRKWMELRPGNSTRLLEAALLSDNPGAELQRYLKLGSQISFTYTKSNSESTRRVVTIERIFETSLQGIDRQDAKSKRFRFDRISEIERC